MIYSHVTVASNRFNLTKEKDYFINPDCYGDDFAHWLITAFKEKKEVSDIDPEPCQEDWGWEVFLLLGGRKFFIGIGPYSEEGKGGWLLFVESQLPFFKRWFGADDSNEQKRLCGLLHDILKDGDGIHEIRWHTKDNFTKGIEDHWKDNP